MCYSSSFISGYGCLLFILSTLFVTELSSKKWVKENIEQTLHSRNCLHPVHAHLFNDLFLYLNDYNTRLELEAIGLDKISVQLRTGLPFCRVLVATTKILRDYLDHKINRMLHKGSSRDNFMANGWLATIANFDIPNRGTKCDMEVAKISVNDTKADTGVFSEVIRCLIANRKRAAMKHIVSKFKEEEDAVNAALR